MIHDNRRINIPTPNGIHISIRNDDVGTSDPLVQMVMEGLRSLKHEQYNPSTPAGTIAFTYIPSNPKIPYYYDVFRDDGLLLRRSVVEGEITRSRDSGLVTIR